MKRDPLKYWMRRLMCFDHTHTSVGAGRLLTCPVSCWHIHDWLVAGVRCRTAEPPDGQVLLFAGELHLGGVCHLRTHLQAGSRHHVLEENENLRWARSQWGTTERNAWKIALKSKITLKSNSICNQKKKDSVEINYKILSFPLITFLIHGRQLDRQESKILM